MSPILAHRFIQNFFYVILIKLQTILAINWFWGSKSTYEMWTTEVQNTFLLHCILYAKSLQCDNTTPEKLSQNSILKVTTKAHTSYFKHNYYKSESQAFWYPFKTFVCKFSCQTNGSLYQAISQYIIFEEIPVTIQTTF